MASKNVERARWLFENGYNCCQSVVAVFSEKYGMDESMAFKVAGGLGGGCCCAEVCGAVSGAILVIGLKYGHTAPNDTDTKMFCRAKTQEYISKFRAANGGHVTCRDLLGCDVFSEEGGKCYSDNDLRNKVCFKAIICSVEILEELGY